MSTKEDEVIFKKDDPKLIIVLKLLLLLLMLALVSIVVLQVLGRYVFLTTPRWTEELSRFLFVNLVFVGFPIVVYERKELRITILLDKLPEKARNIIVKASKILSFLFCGFVIYFGYELFLQMYKRGPIIPTLGIKRAYMFGIVPASFLITLFIFLSRFKENS